MSISAGSSSTHARGDTVSQNDQLAPVQGSASAGPSRSVEYLPSEEREDSKAHDASSPIETYSQEQGSSRGIHFSPSIFPSLLFPRPSSNITVIWNYHLAANASGSASPGIVIPSQDQEKNPRRSTPPTSTSFDEMYSHTPRLSMTDGDLDAHHAEEEKERTKGVSECLYILPMIPVPCSGFFVGDTSVLTWRL